MEFYSRSLQMFECTVALESNQLNFIVQFCDDNNMYRLIEESLPSFELLLLLTCCFP